LFAASPDMQAGKWEVTMKMEMEGAPFPMPPIVYTQCITKDDLKDGKKTVPTSSKNKDDCEVKDYKVSGNKTTWRMKCKDGSTGTGEMTSKGSSYNGVIKLETNDRQHGKSRIVQRISGKRIGDCK
jgi:hypothetical protein